MKKLICLLFAFGLFAGCTPTEKKKDVPPPPKSPDTASAQQAGRPESAKDIVNNYEKGLVTSVDKAKGAQAKIDLAAVQDAVRSFQAENGKYPDSLDAIKAYLRPGTDLSALNYDPGTGAVAIK